MKDLLKEAIADAKAVRETALANAKLALEEAFAPRLQSIISAKMQTEMEEADDEEINVEEEEAVETEETPEMEDSHEDEMEDTSDDDVDVEDFEEEDEDEDVDLEEIIRELESDEDDLEEELDSSEIGVSNNRQPSTDASDSADAGDIDLFEMDDDEDVNLEEDDEEIDLDEVIAALKEEDGEDDSEEIEETESEKEVELEEAYNVIRYLKDKINEVNLLNAKLLYSNKLFKAYDLNERQKMKVIENFDRANNMREVKLVYTTLTESFKSPNVKKVVKESFASKPVGSTKPKSDNVLTEGTELANRFKKLAGLIK
jgi:hypothetical protein